MSTQINDAIRNRYWCCGARITEPHPPTCPTVEAQNRCPVCQVHTRCEHGEWMGTSFPLRLQEVGVARLGQFTY